MYGWWMDGILRPFGEAEESHGQGQIHFKFFFNVFLLMNGRMVEEWMDGWMDGGRMDGWVDKWGGGRGGWL